MTSVNVADRLIKVVWRKIIEANDDLDLVLILGQLMILRENLDYLQQVVEEMIRTEHIGTSGRPTRP